MKKTFKSLALLAIATITLQTQALISCSSTSRLNTSGNVSQKATASTLALWKDSAPAKKALIDYVAAVTDEKSPDFIPVKDRIATFDMDGTFIGELYPTYFEYNMLVYRVFDDPDYKDKAPGDVKETAQNIRDFVEKGTKLPDHFDMKHAYAATKAYSGMTIQEFDSYVKEYAKQAAPGFSGMTFAESFYKPMIEVFDYLNANGFTCYVVSGSDRFICRALTSSLGFEPNRIIGMDVKLRTSNQGEAEGVDYTMKKDEKIFRTDELIIKNLKANKVFQITQEIGKIPVLSFGNSGGDVAMHNLALTNPKYRSAAFMLIADDDTRDYANREKALALGKQWKEGGYNVISMRDDWTTIYGDGVEKK